MDFTQNLKLRSALDKIPKLPAVWIPSWHVIRRVEDVLDHRLHRIGLEYKSGRLIDSKIEVKPFLLQIAVDYHPCILTGSIRSTPAGVEGSGHFQRLAILSQKTHLS